MSNKRIDILLEQGLDTITNLQKKDGSFPSLTTVKNFDKGIECPSIFSTALISICLSEINLPQADSINKRIVPFLLDQKSDQWSYNYWDRNSSWFNKLPYPDDLDDTACALLALAKFDKNLITGSVLAKFSQILTVLETKPGGPYRTWFVPKVAPKVWQDVDLAVNANIASFLNVYGVSLPRVNNFIEQAIIKQKISSPYYATPYPIIYFISQFYSGKYVQQLVDFLFAQRQNNHWGNVLNAALAILALQNFGFETNNINSSLDYILRQKNNWQALPFYTGINPKGNKQRHIAGSQALTTVFCLLALKKDRDKIKAPNVKMDDYKTKILYKKIVSLAKKRTKELDLLLKKNTKARIDDALKRDRDKQVILLPYYFRQSLNLSDDTIKNELLLSLGLANLFGWIAYDMYDDLIDCESDISTLPSANFFFREMVILFSQGANNNIVNTFLNRIEAATLWELANCRFNTNKKISTITLPNFGNRIILADRSIGHAIGPLILLDYLGYNPKTVEYKNILKFFEHYM